ncbi:MAG TPA: malto-oligosyltrehalose trehalohydrolase [Pseudomonadales bacterium]
MDWGASPIDGGVRFRLWAPSASQVELLVDDRATRPMAAVGDGWWELVEPGARAGSRYRYRIDGGIDVPDPASRFQPEDCLGPSQIVDPAGYRWQHGGWTGRPWHEAVIYELHVGTFTPDGTFRGAIGKLDTLVDLGVTAIELMPIADFSGRRNWGYDGVLPFAPDSAYGTPDDLKALIDAAHERGLMVLLDVVYNHFGPEGNFLSQYAAAFFTDRHQTPWGAAINFDTGPESRWVRQFFVDNALYWLEEYRFDGLRLDAVHAIRDDSDEHVLAELARRVREHVGEARHVHLVLENDANEARWLGDGGYEAQWNDDYHHAFHVALTGERDSYYGDYADRPIARAARILAEGFGYQGEHSVHRGEPRGEPSAHLPPTAFVAFLQNHDQIGNRAFGERLHELTAPAALRAATEILLLGPMPPLLFMGQEWNASAPFPFFCDYEGELADAVVEGRRREFAQFDAFRDPAARERIPNPVREETFASARLDWNERLAGAHGDWWRLCHDLLALRRLRVAPRLEHAPGGPARAVTLGEQALQVSWVLAGGVRYTLLANLSDAPLAGVRVPGGECLYGSPDGGDEHTLAPWSVRFYLEASGDVENEPAGTAR